MRWNRRARASHIEPCLQPPTSVEDDRRKMGIQIKAAIDFMTASGIAMPALVPLRRLLGGLEDLDFGTKIDFLAPSPRPQLSCL
jgi:hypothetical protein